MNFSKNERAAREIIINSCKEISLEEIWERLGRDFEGSWRPQALDLMRRVCLKSHIHSPVIKRTTGIGPGSKAKYAVEQIRAEPGTVPNRQAGRG